MRFDIEKTAVMPISDGSLDCIAFFFIRNVRYFVIVRFCKDGLEITPVYTNRGNVSKMDEGRTEFLQDYFFNRFKNQLLNDPKHRLRMISFGFHLEGGANNEKL